MSLIETSKTVYDLAKKAANVELQRQVMQLREEALELQEETLKLRKENLMLKEKIELQEKVKFKRKVYFRDGDEVPFCPYCFERSNLLIHLSEARPFVDGRNALYICQECNKSYETKGEEDFRITY